METRYPRGRRMSVVAVAALATLAGVLPAASAETASNRPQNSRLAAALRADLNSYLAIEGAAEHVSAASVTVTFAGGPGRAVSAAAGTAQWGGGRPVSPDAQWQVGSNTKAFTSVLVLRLEAQGALSIDDKVGAWLPQYPAWKDITIRQLLNMTSGIPDYTEDPAFQDDALTDPAQTFSADRLLRYVYAKPLGKPGYAYTNTSYILAQLIIERAGHDTYAHQIARHLLRPLGLHSTCYAPDTCPPRTADRMPTGYYNGPGPAQGTAVPATELTVFQGAGAVIASLPDLARWERALYSGALLPRKQQRELESLVSTKTGLPITTTSPSDPNGFGLGVGQITTTLTGTAWAYEGETFGFRSIHLYVPATGTLITLAVNSGGVETDHLNDLLVAVYDDVVAEGGH